MMFRTHMIFGLFVAIVITRFIVIEQQLLFSALILLGAVFPDIDHPNSKLGRIFRPISLFFEHRGFFHSLFGLLFFVSLLYFTTASVLFSGAFLIGYASHIFADAFSTQGIMPFHPLRNFRIRGFFRTGHFAEHVTFVLLIFFCITFLFLN